MKYILSLILALVVITANGQKVKINYKGDIHPYKFKIEKAEVKDGNTIFYFKVQQKERFSYNILFDECLLSTNNSSSEIKGTLSTWNDDKRVNDFPKPISDQKEEVFTISFPGTDIIGASQFDIRIGTIQNKNKTPIIFEGIKIKK